MKKEELVSKVSSETGMTQIQVSRVLETMINTIEDELLGGGSVVIREFGTFYVKKRAPKRMINPANGEVYEIPERKAAVFKTGSRLKYL